MASILDKIKKLWNPPDDEYDEYYEEQPVSAEQPVYEEQVARRSPRSDAGRVVSINRSAPQVCAFHPITFRTDSSAVADELNNKNIVILNLEKTDKTESRRILDFLSGVAYANNGKIKRVSTHTYIITPFNVDFSGAEIMDEVENGGFTF